ncbi:F-box/LRR-repeat protein At3g59190-like isoform X1 [Telopea speciosissima]|uniref:F-box/LRR-repeat protein At3g59190-like isoform X1 n=1 Tax=Telopea speciosissima TaxID=54955 RepID=UPI001CC4CF88|nr:F-box/LRR-repeat protein At3g59190-like isoform X1 [Telopea speciosissima]
MNQRRPPAPKENMRARKSSLFSTGKKMKPADARSVTDMVESGDSSSRKLKPPHMGPATERMENEDRISNLPETILCRILSFLDMRYVVQTSLLSRRWRYIWTSVPNLDFDHQYFLSRIGGRDESKNGFMDFVDRVLLLRNSSDIQNFCISCGWYCDINRIHSWIFVAVRRNVHQFHLKIRPKEPLELPLCLFTCKSLRVLKLDMDYVPLELKLPDSMNLPLLKTLHLELVNLEEKLIAKILSGCPALETLILIMCQFKYAKNIIICSHELKKLVVEACSMDHCGSDDCKVNIWAPNLTSLRCVDYMTKEYFLGNLSALVSAEFDMKIGEGRPFEETVELSIERKQLYAQRMIKCLRGLCRVKALTLSAFMLEKNLSWYEKHPVCNEAMLDVANNGDNWEAELPLKCPLHHLKTVEMRNLQGCENELMFLKFVMKNAMVLEEMIIVASKRFTLSGIKEKFDDKLQTFQQASPSLCILFF